METPTLHSNQWDKVIELTKLGQQRNSDPLIWAMQISSILNSATISMPSTQLAKLLVNHICWSNNIPIAWKFLEKALTLRLVPPLFLLSLLSTRVVPSRRRYPAAYRLYMELLKRYAFSLPSLVNGPNYQMIMESINDTLHLSEIFEHQGSESGIHVVEYVFAVVWQLLDASLDDEGLLELTAEKKSRLPVTAQEMEISNHDGFAGKRLEHPGLSRTNTILAIEIIGQFFQDTLTSMILYLARKNMPKHWESFMQHLQLLASNSSALRNSKDISPEALVLLISNNGGVLSRKCKTSSRQFLRAVMASAPLASSARQCDGASPSVIWLPIDLFLEDTMDGSQVAATSAADTLTGLVKALHAVNRTTWQDTFFGLWISALRLVDRERDSIEGPVPRLDTCLSLLLSITPLAITNIIKEEENDSSSRDQREESTAKRHQALVSSLQQLHDYDGLLTPPLPAIPLANQAALKAMMFLSGLSVGSGYFDGMRLNDMPVNCAGNLWHLIVEACIARNILDTSAYLWPGYVNGQFNQVPHSMSGPLPGWSSLMKGSLLTPPMASALVSTPASSLAEIQKIYEIAVNGPDEDKISAATILCGASLARGWNIQEHTVLFITELLSPSVPSDCSGTESHLIGYAPFLNVLLVGISSIDCIKIFSLHGLVPQLAGALMPICEAFGSCAPNVSWTLMSEEITSHAIFSNAFTLLLKLWRFDQPPLEHVTRDATVGSHLTPEYLLLVRNSQLACSDDLLIDQSKSKKLSAAPSPSPGELIFMDSFPKLKHWYRQNQACIASPLSGLVPGTPVHQIVEALLNFMFRKISTGGQSLTPVTSGGSNSSGSGNENISPHLKLPAWDILEAVPFVLDAALTAYAHGRLSPRELATGLKDLADFLPASLATIASCFSAEVTRGIWKPASMNGTDWPSPAANLATVEQQIKKILAATGVDVPSLSVGSSPAILPLPLAAFVSLTITYKLDRGTERFLNLMGPALSNLATSCPWPCMPVVAALWAQKVRRWSDFLVFSASRTVFHHSRDAVVQLLRVCFTATLGLGTSSLESNGGVGSLLGHGFGSHFSGGISPVAPGILYLRVHRAVRNVMFMAEEIVALLMHFVRDIADSGFPAMELEKLRKPRNDIRSLSCQKTCSAFPACCQVSLAGAMTRVKLAASLGASLVWITGGLSLVQSLLKETLPSWFISAHGSEPNGGISEGMVARLRGYALAYFALLSGAFAWGVDSLSPTSKWRPSILGAHLEFLVSALDGKISLGCNKATWRAYVSGFISLMVGCTPSWLLEVDVEVLKRLSHGLKRWNEEVLALALLETSGVGAMGTAAEMIMGGGLNFFS